MKWLTSLKNRKSTVDSTASGQANLIRGSREWWYGQVKNSSEVLRYLNNGQTEINSTYLDGLKCSTQEYLALTHPDVLPRTPSCDNVLRDLVNDHGVRDPSTRDVAVLFCVFTFQPSAASESLKSLMDMEVGRYLRTVSLASEIDHSLVSGDEGRIIQALLSIVLAIGQPLTKFAELVSTLDARSATMFIPLQVVKRALAKSGIRMRIQEQVLSLLERRWFSSIYAQIKQLQSIVQGQKSSEIVEVLNDFFPKWTILASWHPDTARIDCWEHGNFSNVQRKKLSPLFDLDGPDQTAHSHKSLKFAEPTCYRLVQVHPQSTKLLEGLLDLLYKAHGVGSGALDLFIHLCVDNCADEVSLLVADNAIKTNDEAHCIAMLHLVKAIKCRPSLDREMEIAIQVLATLKSHALPESGDFSIAEIARRVMEIMQTAQDEFCAQLDQGLGEYMGMLIWQFGVAIKEATWIHVKLPTEFLNRLQRHPPCNVLEAIFDHLQDCSDSGEFHFRPYLQSSLGGKSMTGSEFVSMESIQEELRFWQRSPDVMRKDLGRTLAKIKNMDYALYTNCLSTMSIEPDLYVEEMKHIIRPDTTETCHIFATYLAKRRALKQLNHECWLLLLIALIQDKGPSYFPDLADSMPFEEWWECVKVLMQLFEPIRQSLVSSGDGLTGERLSWWAMLAENRDAMHFLIERQRKPSNYRWIYFPSTPNRIPELLEILKQGRNMTAICHQVVSKLEYHGGNVGLVCDCIRAIERTSKFGRAVSERMLGRHVERWSNATLDLFVHTWLRNPMLSAEDAQALLSFQQLFLVNEPQQSRVTVDGLTKTRLRAEYDILMDRAKKLENLRRRLQRWYPERVATILQKAGIDNTRPARAVSHEVPDDLVDSVETCGESEFEMTFALTKVGELQRRARGIPEGSRVLLLRLCLKGNPGFCIHFSPTNEGPSQHQYWRSNNEPNGAMCTMTPNLFTYYLGRKLYRLQQNRDRSRSLQTFYSAVQDLITKSPDSCVVCPNTIGTKLWKPSTCSKKCSLRLRTAPLEVRLHNLLIDPLTIDLLLTSVYAAADLPATPDLLPGCPVPRNRLKTVIDSIPPLVNLQRAKDLQRSIRDNDQTDKYRERLLSWLCLNFRGFLISAPEGFRIPSMPQTQQFLLVNSHHEREERYNAQFGSRNASGVVFHGTQASRLFSILTTGLEDMTGTPYMQHGAARGPGIYCADDQSTCLYYAGTTGQSWSNSSLGNMRVMLGCELASYTPSIRGSVHVIPDKNRLLVRYVFLLPQTYQCPQRHHVEPAMKTAFAALRSGLLP